MRAAPARPESPVPVAVGYAFDNTYDPALSPPPAPLVDAVNEALSGRNLPPTPMGFEDAARVFVAVRDSANRYAKVVQAVPATPLVLLVETRAEFLTASQGLYSWRVFVKLTAGRRQSKDAPLSREFELPAALQFDHEKGPEAVAQVARVVADRAADLLNNVLQLPPPAPVAEDTPEKPKATPPAKAAGRALPTADGIYFVLLDRFANGNPGNDGAVDAKDPAAFHGGDLAGLTAHLDDLQALGVRTVWLSPFFKTRHEKFFGHGAFHGYWVEDLREVEPRFGTLQELRALSDALHARGMKLYLDLVLNHTSFDAPLTREHPDWFHHQGDIKDWNDPRQVENGDVMGLPDLAQEKSEVEKYLLDASLKWIEAAQPDGFRLDAVRHVPLSFWVKLSERVHEAAGSRFFLLGELLDGSPSVLARAQREGKFDGLFDFPLYYAMVDVFCQDKPPARLGAVLSSDRFYASPEKLVTLLDNHDLPRVMSACHGELDRVKAALTFQLTARGSPSLTYGIEAALMGEKEPLNRSDMRFDERPLKDFITRLLKVRATHGSLLRGANQLLTLGDGVFGYARVDANEAALIYVNQRSRPYSVGLPAEVSDAALVDALTEEPVQAPLVVPPGSTRVVFARPRGTDGFASWAGRAREQGSKGERRRAVEVVSHGAPAGAESVYVVGSAPELGAWDPARAPGPVGGKGFRLELPVDGMYEFKLVVRRRGQQPQWEPGENHVLFLKDKEGPAKLEVSWGR
jgi:glycosidase